MAGRSSPQPLHLLHPHTHRCGEAAGGTEGALPGAGICLLKPKSLLWRVLSFLQCRRQRSALTPPGVHSLLVSIHFAVVLLEMRPPCVSSSDVCPAFCSAFPCASTPCLCAAVWLCHPSWAPIPALFCARVVSVLSSTVFCLPPPQAVLIQAPIIKNECFQFLPFSF